MRGEQHGWPVQRDRALLGNVFNSNALRESLSTQQQSYSNPFRDESTVKNLDLATRKNNRQREFRMRAARDGHEEATADEPSLNLNLGKGKGNIAMRGKSSNSKSKGKGKSKSTKDSKSKGRSKSRGSAMSASMVTATGFPTFAPSHQAIGVPTSSPAVTPVACSPTSTFFPPDVRDFFQAPSGDSSDLQNELDSALTQIQVPSEFEQQCVER